MKKLLIFLLPVLAAGGVVGAAFLGYINIPGITPAKKKAGAAGLYGEGAAAYGEKADDPLAKAAPKEKTAPPKAKAKAKEKDAPKKQEPEIDPFAGERRLARVWNELETSALLRITAEWKTEDLARQLSVMSSEKVVEVLSQLEPKRASDVSRELQRLGVEAAKRSAAEAGP